MSKARYFQRAVTYGVFPNSPAFSFHRFCHTEAEATRPPIPIVEVPTELAEKFSACSASFLQQFGHKHSVPYKTSVQTMAAHKLTELDQDGFLDRVAEQQDAVIVSGIPLGTTPTLSSKVHKPNREQLKAAGTPILFVDGLMRGLSMVAWEDTTGRYGTYFDVKAHDGHSSSDITWHCDMPMFGSAKPDVTSLTCLNSEGNVRTAFLPAEKIFHALSSSSQEILQEKMFAFYEGGQLFKPFSVFEVAADGSVSMTFDADARGLKFRKRADIARDAVDGALTELGGVIQSLGEQAPAHALKPGEALIIENAKGMHARLDHVPHTESRWAVREQWRREHMTSQAGILFS